MTRARDNANLSPTIADARMPNLTGDVTTVEGAVATTIATDAVDIAMLSATGTADGTTFLRGDNAWAEAGGYSGTGAFLAAGNAASWTGLSTGDICPFAIDSPTSTQDVFDTDGNYDATTYKYEAPATGVYFFFFSIYTSQHDTTNAFGFATDAGIWENTYNTGENRVSYSELSGDHIQSGSMVIPLSSGTEVWVVDAMGSDFYKGRSCWGGCRLS